MGAMQAFLCELFISEFHENLSGQSIFLPDFLTQKSVAVIFQKKVVRQCLLYCI